MILRLTYDRHHHVVGAQSRSAAFSPSLRPVGPLFGSACRLATSVRPAALCQGATAASVIVLMPVIRAVRSSVSWWRAPRYAGSR
jgi:hypothetical protein